MIRHFSPAPQVLACELRDYPEWHRGRERYAVWLIDADTPAVRERLALLQEQLGDLFVPQRRQPHITLFVCGFIDGAVTLDDDFDSQALPVQQQALQHLALPAFELRIGGPDSFDSAAFLRIDDPAAALPALREALGRGAHEIRFGPYVPHLTLGLYRAAFAKDALRARFAALPALPPLRLRVEQLHFCSYAARELGSPLETLLRVGLAPADAGRDAIIDQGWASAPSVPRKTSASW